LKKYLFVIALMITSLTSSASCDKSLSVKISLGFDLILGENSIALFDHLQTEEVAGLLKNDANKKIDSETSAFIAGLTNIHQGKWFVFLNMKRIRKEPSIMVHESVHMAKVLMTLKYLPDIDVFKDPYLPITDENEEEFAEMVELVYELIESQVRLHEPNICHAIQTL
jgi:hypothetical protein